MNKTAILRSRLNICQRALLFGTVAVGMMLMAARSVRAQSAKHPLDDLTTQEYWTAVHVLQEAGKSDAATRYPLIHLNPPPKEEVLAWKPGQPMRSEAQVVIRQGARGYEAIVDVKGSRLVSWKELKGVQPPISPEEEIDQIGNAVKEVPEVQAALKKRGITNPESSLCVAYPRGYFGTAEEQGRRMFGVECWDRFGPLDDFGPIEGLTILWDADANKVIRIIDTGVLPIPKPPTNFDPASLAPQRDVPTSISVQQPLGPSFRLDGQTVSWQKWNFHFRVDRRVGLVVTNVGYQDGEKPRSILYEGSLSELFVPYMDPDEQ